MKLKTIIKIADKAYGDGLVEDYFNGAQNPDDTLAQFVAVELESTYEPTLKRQRQLEEAAGYMEAAIIELARVRDALLNAAEAPKRRTMSDAAKRVCPKFGEKSE